MPVDTSIYQQPQRPDLFQQFGNAFGVVNQANQNKLFQQEFSANRAIGPIYQQSIDPETGELDTNKLLKLASENPATAWKAGEIAQQALARQQTQTAIKKDQLDMAFKQNQGMNGRLGALLAMDNPSSSDVMRGLTDAVSAGMLTPQRAAAEAAGMPTDPAQIKMWLQQHMLQNQQAGDQLKAIYGETQMINTGQTQTPVAVSPMTGTRQIGPSFQNQAGPEALLPYGNVTAADRARIAQSGADVINIDQPGGGTLPYTRGALAGTGGLGSTQQGAMPIAGLSLTPGQKAGQTVAGEGSAKALQDVRDKAAATGEQIYVLNQASRALEGTKTGIGRGTLNDLGNFVNSVSGANLVDPSKIANFEEVKKYLVQNAIRESGSMGSGTDSKLAAAFSGSPNTSLSTLTNKQIIDANVGLLKYRQAMALAAQQQGVAPDKFSDWQAKFAKQVPVEAFVWPSLDADQRRKVADKMTPDQKAEFMQALQWGQDNGFH